MMDVGNPGYQAQWLSNVSPTRRSGGWDGVFMDDTNTDMSWHLNGRTIAKYPTPPPGAPRPAACSRRSGPR